MQANTPNYTPTPETVASAWKLIVHERSQLVALSIVLAARIEERERHEEHDSTELLLAQLLEQHISSTSAMNAAHELLTGIR